MKFERPEDIYDHLAQFINAENTMQLHKLFTENATIIPPHHQPEVNAKEAISRVQGVFRQHEGYEVRFKINSVESDADDRATVRYSWTGEGGRFGKYTFDGTDEVQRQSDGGWLISKSHPFETPRYDKNNKPIDF